MRDGRAVMSNPSSSFQVSKRGPFVLARIALQDGLSSGECPICYSSRKTTRRYIHSFLYEGMMSSLARQGFLDGGGFCREHFWQAKAIENECWADGFGVAILCENLLSAFVKDLEKADKIRAGLKTRFLKVRRRGRRRKTHFPPGPQGPACDIARSTGDHYLKTLEELLDDSDFCEDYRRSTGLCLSHVYVAIESWTSETAVESVRRLANSQVNQLINELREFERKHDYQYKHEPRGSEWSPPERAIDFLVGRKPKSDGFDKLKPARRASGKLTPTQSR